MNKKRPTISKALRVAVIERAYGCCEYCLIRADYSPDFFEIEHIVPFSLGGTSALENLALSCGGCNNSKSNAVAALDYATMQEAPLFHPRMHNWDEHFRWSEDYTEIRGFTPTGRATIVQLKLNRPALKNLRYVLHAFGKHPPDRSPSTL